MSNFREFDRETSFLLPPSLDKWLPEQHLARFVVEVIDGLDLSAMVTSYRSTGSAGYHPALLLGLLVYGYATGVFSSRKLERATYDSVAFRFIAANDHPDHDTIATFRRRFLKDIEGLFVRVLELAREMGMLKLGTVALDGTKIHANAGRHCALSYEHAGKIDGRQADIWVRPQRLFETQAQPILISSSNECGARCRADGGVRIGLKKPHPIRRNAVDVRGVEIGAPVARHVSIAHVVCQDKDDIRLGGLGDGMTGRRERKRAGGTGDQITAREPRLT
jgi:transposase